MTQTEKFQRKPFTVDAIRVTQQNMSEVAQWCGGEIIERADDSTDTHIKVRVTAPMSERATQARVGDWVVYMSATGYKVFTHKSFKKNFESVFQVPREALPVNHEKVLDETGSFSTRPHTESIFDKAETGDPGQETTVPGPDQDKKESTDE